jgi:hypothetical protein
MVMAAPLLNAHKIGLQRLLAHSLAPIECECIIHGEARAGAHLCGKYLCRSPEELGCLR